MEVIEMFEDSFKNGHNEQAENRMVQLVQMGIVDKGTAEKSIAGWTGNANYTLPNKTKEQKSIEALEDMVASLLLGGGLL